MFTSTELKVACTTAFTILFFMLLCGEAGLLASFAVAFIWFMIWCVLNTLLYFINTRIM